MRAPFTRVLAAVLVCAAVLAACTDSKPVDGVDGGRPHASPAGGQVDEPAGGAAPFDLRVERIAVVGMGNAAVRGVPGPAPSNEAAELAVEAARRSLAAFLNAQLADEHTRFSAAPIDALLSARARAAASDEHRAGLGQVALPAVRTITGPASAVAQVLVDGTRAHAVTLTYTAMLTVELAGGRQEPVKQTGSMTFLPTDEGWRADAVEVATDVPEIGP